jgi:hypothetical protein
VTLRDEAGWRTIAVQVRVSSTNRSLAQDQIEAS